MEDEYRLTIEIKNTEPVELVDLTNSLLSLADEYKRYLVSQTGPTLADEIKLYVKEIKTGSIITDLVAIAPGAFPFAQYAMTVIDFSGYMKKAISFFLGDKGEDPKLDKRSYENFSTFLEPVAKDKASQLNWHNTINGDVNLVLNLGSIEANALQNTFRKKIETLQEPVTGLKEDVLLYWYQARNDPKSQAGDRAIIESISKGPVRALVDEDTKFEMLSGTENPFQLAYLVDVEVETINGKPSIYKVSKLHKKFNKDG